MLMKSRRFRRIIGLWSHCIRLAITPDGGGSELVIRHEKLERTDAIERHAAGWRGAVDQLTQLLAEEEHHDR